MGSSCIVSRVDGRACAARGVVFDPLLGGLVCYHHAPLDQLLAHVIRHAMGTPDRYLAAALAELTDEWLAAELGCPQDLASMATVLDGDAARGGALLRRLAPGRLPLA